MSNHDEAATAHRARLRAGILSLVVSVALLGAKFAAYLLTGSTAILSDAMESIANVAAAMFALAALSFAQNPADQNHPYGHGKIEFFSAGFEGGLIAFAALLILGQAGVALVRGNEVHQLDLGLAITLGAGLANAALGWFLIRTGTRHHSLTLVADGQHVLSDFWTSAGVVVGLLLVRITGWSPLDPIVAAIVGVNLCTTGVRLVRRAAGGLLDEVEPGLLENVVEAINSSLVPGAIRVHRLRARRAGHFTHIDGHFVVPEHWSVEQAHDFADAYAGRVIDALPFDGEILFHTDPCRRLYCRSCDFAECPIRTAPFVRRNPITVEEAVQPDADPRLVRSVLSAEDSGLRTED